MEVYSFRPVQMLASGSGSFDKKANEVFTLAFELLKEKQPQTLKAIFRLHITRPCVYNYVCMCYLGGAVDWEILHWRDETLGDQLTIGGRSLPLDKFCLHASHLSLKGSTAGTQNIQVNTESYFITAASTGSLQFCKKKKCGVRTAGGLVSSPVLSAPE